METAQSPGDDTHAAVNTGQEGVRARTTRRVGSSVSMGCRLGPSIDRRSDKHAGKSECETQTLCASRPGTKITKERNCDKNKTLKDNAVKAIGTRAFRPFSVRRHA